MKLCNLNYLKSVSPKSNTFAIQIITLFLKDTPIAISSMKKALDSDKYFEIYKNGIKIKPSFQMLGLHSNYSLKLEEILSLANAMNEKEKLIDFIKDLEKEMKKVYPELEKELQELQS